MRDRTDVGAGRAPDADDSLFLDGALGELADALRAPVDFGAGVDAAVMAAVRLAPPLAVVTGGAAGGARPGVAVRLAQRPAARPAAVVRAARWLARPRPVRVSPLGALMAAGLAFAAVVGLRRDGGRSERGLAATGEHPAATGEYPVAAALPAAAPAVPAAAPARDTVFIQRFVLVAPGARQVALAGDFNGWDDSATRLVKAAGGVWTVELPLSAGRYQYAFVVDGHRWTADPAAPRAVGDDFGRPSSVLTVRGA